MKKGDKMPEETRAKLRESAKQQWQTRVLSEEQREKMRDAKRGKKQSEETRRKRSASLKGRAFTEEHLEKAKNSLILARAAYKASGKSRKGSKQTEDAKRKLSESNKRRGAVPPSRKGIPNSDEQRKKISATLKAGYAARGYRPIPKMQGELNPAWKGGVTPQTILVRRSPAYSAWRSAVLSRDAYTCQMCGIVGVRLQVHHKQPFAGNPELRLDISNGITYCKECHKKMHQKARE